MSCRRQHHPDFHQGASPEEQTRALTTSALVNAAYRALRDPVRRIEYLVRLEEGRDSEEGKEGNPKAPPGLLAEMFEIQEALQEAKGGGLDEAGLGWLCVDQRDELAARCRAEEAASARSRSRRRGTRRRPPTDLARWPPSRKPWPPAPISGPSSMISTRSWGRDRSSMSRIIGIDLGTTNSLVAYVDEGTGLPRVIPDDERRSPAAVGGVVHAGRDPGWACGAAGASQATGEHDLLGQALHGPRLRRCPGRASLLSVHRARRATASFDWWSAIAR